jgi:hypothetical protein
MTISLTVFLAVPHPESTVKQCARRPPIGRSGMGKAMGKHKSNEIRKYCQRRLADPVSAKSLFARLSCRSN